MALDIGRIAYQGYVDKLGEEAKECPKWEELDKLRQDSWRASAIAALQYVDQEKIDFAKKELSFKSNKYAMKSISVEDAQIACLRMYSNILDFNWSIGDSFDNAKLWGEDKINRFNTLGSRMSDLEREVRFFLKM